MSEQLPRIVSLCRFDFVELYSCTQRSVPKECRPIVNVKAAMITSINEVGVEASPHHSCSGKNHAGICTIEGRSIIVHHSRSEIVEAMEGESWQ